MKESMVSVMRGFENDDNLSSSAVVESSVEFIRGAFECGGLSIQTEIWYGSLLERGPNIGSVKERSDVDVLYISAEENFPDDMDGCVGSREDGYEWEGTFGFSERFPLSGVEVVLMTPKRVSRILEKEHEELSGYVSSFEPSDRVVYLQKGNEISGTAEEYVEKLRFLATILALGEVNFGEDISDQQKELVDKVMKKYWSFRKKVRSKGLGV